jgi:hypothetical protein
MGKSKPKGVVSKRKFKELQQHVDGVGDEVLRIESAYLLFKLQDASKLTITLLSRI